MDAARWRRIESLCLTGLWWPPAERSAYLDRACAGDEELRREVEALLEQLDADPTFLEEPLVRIAPAAIREIQTKPCGGARICRAVIGTKRWLVRSPSPKRPCIRSDATRCKGVPGAIENLK